VRIGKRFKNGDFNINDKERSGRLAAVKEDEIQKDRKKLWKTMENTSIRLIYIISIFFIVIKNCKKSAITFAPI